MGKSIPERPEPARFVNDYASLLAESEAAELERLLLRFDSATTNQVVFASIQSLDGETIEAYAQKWAEDWGIGQKEKNNGVFVLLAKQDRAFRIEVGYGLEGVLTDYESSLIFQLHVLPHLKEGHFFQAFYACAEAILHEIEPTFKLRKEYSPLGNKQWEDEYKVNIPPKPENLTRITDFPDWLSEGLESTLETDILAFEKEYRGNLFFVILPEDWNKEGETLSAVAREIMYEWTLGESMEGKIVVVIDPNTFDLEVSDYWPSFLSSRELTLEDQEGLRKTFREFAEEQKYYGGIKRLINQLGKLQRAKIERVKQQLADWRKEQERPERSWLDVVLDGFLLLLLTLAALIILYILFNFASEAGVTSSGSNSYSSSGSSYSSYSSSSSSSSYSSSGGGYSSSFGGGSFGGGGSTGHW